MRKTISKFKKVRIGVVLGAMMLSLVACGKDSSDSNLGKTSPAEIAEEKDDKITEAPSSDEIAEEKADEGTEPASNEENSMYNIDIAAMSYEEAKEYMNSLPETDASYFEITTDVIPALPEGEAAIRHYNGPDKIVVIPEEIDGFKITCIGPMAFNQNENVLAIKLPENTRILNKHALGSCFNLTYVTNMMNLESIGDYAFMNTKVLNYEFSEKLTDFGWDSWYPAEEYLYARAPKDSAVVQYMREVNEGYHYEFFIIEEY